MSRIPTEFLQLDGIRIAYTHSGDGPTLLLLHGNSGSKAMFADYQTKHFHGFRTYALDSRGHGESRSEDTVLTYSQIADDVIAFCKAREINRAYVIGYSDGGNVGLFLAAKEPQLFERILAISPNTLVSGMEEKSLKLIQRIIKVQQFFSRLGFDMKRYLLCFDMMMHDIGLSNDDLKSIQTSVKILYAEKDMIKEEHIRWLASQIPNASLDKVMNCTHLSIPRSPETIRIMQEFLH